jgi:hypothetical protein
MDKMPVDEMTVNRIKVKKMSKLNIHRQVFRGKMSVDVMTVKKMTVYVMQNVTMLRIIFA